jgi:hypothetical protein
MPDRAQLDAVMVRRMKSELKLNWDGSRRFAERVIKHMEVPYTEEERTAHRVLQEYSQLRLKNADTAGERFAAEFVFKLLKKRLFSSPAAFSTTLEKHIASVGTKKTSVSFQREFDDYDEDYSDDEQYESETAEVVGSASQSVIPAL